jgi:hypothetical protein
MPSYVIEVLDDGKWTATEEGAANAATAKAMAEREANAKRTPARYRERGSARSFTVQPA